MNSFPHDSPDLPPPPPEQAEGVVEMNDNARLWAMFAHLGTLAGYLIPFGNIIAPLLIWQIKKDELPFAGEHGKESLNFQISVTIYVLISAALFCAVIGMFLLPVVLVFELVFVIIAAIKANGGYAYRYPLTIRLIK